MEVFKTRWLVLLLVVLSTVGIVVFSWWNSRQAQYASSVKFGDGMYKAILTDASRQEKLEALEGIVQSDSRYKHLAQLGLASLLDDTNSEKSLSIYSELVNNDRLDPVAQDLAAYLKAALLARTGGDGALMEQIGEENGTRKGAVVYGSSLRELEAVALLKLGKMEEAKGVLDGISRDFNTQPIVRKHSEELLQIYFGQLESKPDNVLQN